MRIIAKSTLRDCWEKHAITEQPLKAWFQEVSKVGWRNHNELKADYPSASILSDNRIVFNIKGNHYRIIVKVNFAYQMMWIRFVGTHAEYNKIDANKI